MGERIQSALLALGGLGLLVFAVCGKLHADAMVAERPAPVALGPIQQESAEPVRILSALCLGDLLG